MSNVKKLVLLALFLAIAIILNIIENAIIIPITIPGVKLGLANLASLLILILFNYKDMIIINLMRILLVSMISGTLLSLPFYISLGSSLSVILVTYPFYKTNVLSIFGLSMLQASIFNIAQIMIICLIYQNTIFIYYLPYLILTGLATGYIMALIMKQIITKSKLNYKIS